MISERLSAVKKWWKDMLPVRGDWEEFDECFPRYYNPNGVLTISREEENPVLRGLICARNSYSLMKKIASGEELNDKQRREIREAVWLTSFSGLYEIKRNETDNNMQVTIIIDDDKPKNYLLANIKGITAFLSNRDVSNRKTYYLKAKSVIAEDDSLTFSFENYPETIARPMLYIHSQTEGSDNIQAEYKRLIFLLAEVRH